MYRYLVQVVHSERSVFIFKCKLLLQNRLMTVIRRVPFVRKKGVFVMLWQDFVILVFF